jgi:hypothetical protein
LHPFLLPLLPMAIPQVLAAHGLPLHLRPWEGGGTVAQVGAEISTKRKSAREISFVSPQLLCNHSLLILLILIIYVTYRKTTVVGRVIGEAGPF